MKTETQSQWATNYEYTEKQLNKLVRGTDKPYQFCLIDYYGNKTNYFSINAEQFEAVGDILKNIEDKEKHKETQTQIINHIYNIFE
jgi:hypothetical protein